MAKVILDGLLRQFGAPSTTSVDATTVGELIDELEGKYPRLRGKFRNELGEIRQFVRVFRNGELLEPKTCISTALGSRDQVDILHSIAGG